MSSQRPSPPGRGRSIPVVYGGASAVLIVGVLTVALVTPPPSTPPLAAVAPAPQEQVEVERIEQESRFGDGAAGNGTCQPGEPGCAGVGEDEATDRAVTPSHPPSDPEVIEQPSPGRFRNCFHGPGGPRQTEDPQSPPCKREIFIGDNGGATAPGVTAESIRVGVPWPLNGYFTSGQGNNIDDDRIVVEAFVAHFNRFYEFYGRSIELVWIDRQDEFGPAGDRAYAQEVASHEVFAMLEGGSPTLLRSLADRDVVAVAIGRNPISDAEAYARTGRIVGLFPSTEQTLLATADLACTALVGRPAQHGGADVAETARVFGIIGQRGQTIVDASPLTERLEGCGGPLVTRDIDPATDDLAQTLRLFRDQGVTTVVCACTVNIITLTNKAVEIGWAPEWLLPGFAATTGYDQWKQVDASQREHIFGVTTDFRHLTDRAVAGQDSLDLEERFWFHVLSAEAPAHVFPRNNRNPAIRAHDLYSQLLVLASGIQWAGPDLTATTFADALTRLDHPNPDVGAEPWRQPAVGFGPGDRTFNSDVALVWWSLPDDAATTGAEGMSCFVGGGTRFEAGHFPVEADDLFFDPESGCR